MGTTSTRGPDRRPGRREETDTSEGPRVGKNIQMYLGVHLLRV